MCKKIDDITNNYYVEIYDIKGNYITFFNNIKALTKEFNIKEKEILKNIRNNRLTILNNEKYYLYLNPKKLDYKDIKYEKRTR